LVDLFGLSDYVVVNAAGQPLIFIILPNIDPYYTVLRLGYRFAFSKVWYTQRFGQGTILLCIAGHRDFLQKFKNFSQERPPKKEGGLCTHCPTAKEIGRDWRYFLYLSAHNFELQLKSQA
jgi:hypothetical protein